MSAALLVFLRSLGFGGLLGAGVFGPLYCLLLHRIIPGVSLQEFTAIGGLLGARTSHFAGRFAAILFDPIGRRVEHYSKIAELDWQVRPAWSTQ